MVKDHWGKCDRCGEERRWAYAGNYRAYYCDVDKKTTLEQWDQTKNIWVRKMLHELQSSS